MPAWLALNVLLVAQLVRKLVGLMLQLVRLTTCDPNGVPAQVGSPGANSLKVTVPVGGLLLPLGTRPIIVAVSERFTGGAPLVPSVPPEPGVVLIVGNEISADPRPPPGLVFTASVALAPPSTAVCTPLRDESASLVAVAFTLKVKLIVQIPLTGSVNPGLNPTLPLAASITVTVKVVTAP